VKFVFCGKPTIALTPPEKDTTFPISTFPVVVTETTLPFGDEPEPGVAVSTKDPLETDAVYSVEDVYALMFCASRSIVEVFDRYHFVGVPSTSTPSTFTDVIALVLPP
jgi:hypothetical protein